MTIGSRIQALRKERGMSQEELANKLSVSRQTVSQWETGQTAPSIDNIYTLKDIFGVSFDALMSERQTESPQKAPAAVIPHKHGEITYNPEDIKSATRIVFMPRILRTLFVAVLFTIVLSASVIGDDRIDIPGFCIAALIFTIAVLIKQIIGAASYKKSALQKSADRKYEYDLYADRMVITVMRRGELSSRFVVRYGDVSKILENQTHAVFVHGGNLFILRKSEPLCDAVRPYIGVGKNTVAASGKGNVISILLIILSILCPFFALTALEAAVPDVPSSFALGEAVNRMWIFYLFLPIPTASIIFGFYQNKKGIRNVRNIIVGLILAVILAVYGSFTPIFKDSYISDNLAAEKYAAEINIELPKSEKCVINKLFEGEVRSSVLCEKTSFDAFFQNAKSDDRWKKELPTELQGCAPAFTLGEYDLCLIYNADTGEFNTLPEKSGEYHFIFIAAKKSDRTLEIADYTRKFTASGQSLPGAA